MDRVHLSISDNGLEAIVRIEPGPSVEAEELARVLAEAGVVFGVDPRHLRELGKKMADPEYRHAGVIARGLPPEHGRDGRLEFPFSLEVAPGKQAVDGTVDWRERGFLHGFAAGDPVARYLPPTPGRPGRSVLDREIAPRPGADTLPELGEGIEHRPDGTLVATRDGVLRHIPGRLLDVVPLYVHDGDVDLQSGNLHARGSIRIQGDVQQDLVVEASADVEVGGAVLGGKVFAGGTALVRQGVQGKDSTVRAGRDLTCRHATQATLIAGGCLRVLDHAMHCRLRAERIELDRGRGQVVGGELRARRCIVAREAGSETGTQTLLSVADLSDRYAELLRLQQDGQRLRRRGAKMALATGGGDRGAKLTRAAAKAGDRLHQNRQELDRLAAELLASAEITVRGTAHSGVRVQFGSYFLELTDAVRGARFTFDSQRHTILMEA